MSKADVSKKEETNFDWHAEVGKREMHGTAASAAQRDSRKRGAIDLMLRDPAAGTQKIK